LTRIHAFFFIFVGNIGAWGIGMAKYVLDAEAGTFAMSTGSATLRLKTGQTHPTNHAALLRPRAERSVIEFFLTLTPAARRVLTDF
jgi:hypothetical protein